MQRYSRKLLLRIIKLTHHREQSQRFSSSFHERTTVKNHRYLNVNVHRTTPIADKYNYTSHILLPDFETDIIKLPPCYQQLFCLRYTNNLKKKERNEVHNCWFISMIVGRKHRARGENVASPTRNRIINPILIRFFYSGIPPPPSWRTCL